MKHCAHSLPEETTPVRGIKDAALGAGTGVRICCHCGKREVLHWTEKKRFITGHGEHFWIYVRTWEEMTGECS